MPDTRIPLAELAAERLQSLRLRRSAAALRARAMTTPFPKHAEQRLLLVTQKERIPQSQIFPFHHYADSLYRRFGAAVREVPMEHALNSPHQLPDNATTIAFQAPYDIADAELETLISQLRCGNPYARLVYLDWSAPTDLRNAERLNPHIDVYVKKHVLRDRSVYRRPTLGDTNLSDHYARRLGLDDEEQCFAIPYDFMPKLLVGPSFVTAPLLLPLLREGFDEGPDKTVDLHARFAVAGTPWYEGMRSEAEAALATVSDLRIAVGNTLPLYKFIAELRRSKICFSPFGYGEVCWRDYEAIMAGAVLLKPDMSHIETNPDIFRPWETYAPLRWDLSDFGETVRRLLSDDDLCLMLKKNAHQVLHDYLLSDAFADQMQPLFYEGPL